MWPPYFISISADLDRLREATPASVVQPEMTAAIAKSTSNFLMIYSFYFMRFLIVRVILMA